jgi:hypothetical protein
LARKTIITINNPNDRTIRFFLRSNEANASNGIKIKKAAQINEKSPEKVKTSSNQFIAQNDLIDNTLSTPAFLLRRSMTSFVMI